MEKRCKNCNRLLFIEINGQNVIKCNNIEYTINLLSMKVKCKCGRVN